MRVPSSLDRAQRPFILVHASSRRVFLKGLLAACASMLTTTAGVVGLPTSAVAARKPMAFAFAHDHATTIVIDRSTNPTRLDIEVRHLAATVERFESADPYQLDRLRSMYFSVTYFDPPAN